MLAGIQPGTTSRKRTARRADLAEEREVESASDALVSENPESLLVSLFDAIKITSNNPTLIPPTFLPSRKRSSEADEEGKKKLCNLKTSSLLPPDEVRRKAAKAAIARAVAQSSQISEKTRPAGM